MSAVMNRMSPDITSMIRMDHTHVLAVFHRYKSTTPLNRKRALVTNACLALQVHAQLEEEIFYPALRNVLGSDEVLDKSEPEHQQMRDLINDLREQSARSSEDATIDQDSFDDKFRDLMRIVMHHVADEETRLLPAAERLLGDQLGQLGMEMTRRRMQLLKPHAAEIAASTARSFPVGTATGAALLTAGAVALGAMLMSRSRNGSRAGHIKSESHAVRARDTDWRDRSSQGRTTARSDRSAQTRTGDWRDRPSSLM